MVGGLAGPSPLSAQEPAEDEAALRRALGERSFRENCLICHGPEMTTGQRLSADQWKAEMVKMLDWGAPVPAEQVADLTDWLIAEFPPGKPVEPPPIVPAGVLDGAAAPGPIEPRPSAGEPARGRDLYAQHCATCHGADAQGGDLGPNLVERPVLLRDEDWSAAVLTGRRRMPGYAEVLTPRQSDEIRAWLLGRTYTAAR
jgi:mono/diheme cytochrome c family protein